MGAFKKNIARNVMRYLSAILVFLGINAPTFADGSADNNLFEKPYIDVDEWRDVPTRHHYIHGGFRDTETRFSFYFPAKEKYQGRFFQYITPVPDSENLAQQASGEEDKISFSIVSGAYFIETNGGGPNAANPMSGMDPTIGAYKANAAAAQYSRVIAKQLYGGKRPYGYAFGGSGGAFRTIGGLENTSDVWDGAVPYVIGSPMAIPNVFSVRMHAMRMLKNKFPQIIDAVEPGGSGDMYAGLSDEERAALQEVTRMGFPPKSWFGYKTMGVHAFAVLYPGIVMADPSYFKDFWTKPGYLGADSPESLAKDRIQYRSTIKRVVTDDDARAMNLDIERMPGQSKGTADKAWQSMQEQQKKMPVAYELTSTPPDVDFLGGDLMVQSGNAVGKTLMLRKIIGDIVVLGVADPKVAMSLQPGDQVQVDNSNFIAAQTYHRHQVPGKEFYVWDQFRDKEDQPIYPQRRMLLGPLFAAHASGTVQSGKFQGKMIVVESLWDREAFPWQADWYRSKVKENLGDKLDDNFRLWYVDHALHSDSEKQEDPTHTVSYLGILQQALRDLANWVEHGVAPPATTNYRVVDGQVIVPPTATERKGIQPTITLKANGAERADVKVNQPVVFAAVIDVPAHTGSVVSAEWDFDGTGDFSVKEKLNGKLAAKNHVELKRTLRFSSPGAYFVTLRVASQRQGLTATPFTRIQNLERVRIVVK